MSEDGANQESLWCRNWGIEWRGAGEECEELRRGKFRRSRKAMVEKVEDGCIGGRDQPDETTFEIEINKINYHELAKYRN